LNTITLKARAALSTRGFGFLGDRQVIPAVADMLGNELFNVTAAVKNAPAEANVRAAFASFALSIECANRTAPIVGAFRGGQ
jgi:hypothetical protein